MTLSPHNKAPRSLLRLGAAQGSGVPLYCLPFAGGTAHFYQDWALPRLKDLPVHAVELPGRGLRLRESLVPDMSSLVDDLLTHVMPAIEGPFALFGHSMGALLAYELTRALARMGRPLPSLLLVSACRAPHLPARNDPWHDLPEDALITEVENLAGTPLGALQNDDIRAMMVPVFRSDFRLVEQYCHQPAAPLPVPIKAFGGADDPLVYPEDLAGWADHTTDFRGRRLFHGGHFYLNAHADDLAADLRRTLASAVQDHATTGESEPT